MKVGRAIKTSVVPTAASLMKKILNCESMLSKDDLTYNHGLKFITRLGNFYGFGPITKETKMQMKYGKIRIHLTDNMTFLGIEDSVELIIPERMSGVIYEEDIIISNEKQFESIFRYHEKILSVIYNKSTITNNLFNDSTEFMAAMKTDPAKARKVYMAYSDNNIAKNISTESLMIYANTYTLDIKLDNNDNTKISFEDSNLWHIVHAIAEDYYTGFYSKNKYEAGSKRKKK